MKEKQKKTQLERHEEDLRFLDPTFEEYRDDENSPKSFFQLVVAYLKNAVNGIIHHLPEILIPMLIVSVALFAFNIWFWSIKNDTMWMGRGTVGKNPLSPYLVGGGVYEGTPFKGVAPYDKPGVFDSGSLVAPLTFAMGFLIAGIIYRMIFKGALAPMKDIVSILPLKKHYDEENIANGRQKQSGLYFKTGLLCACVAGFLIRNPIAVFVFALVFFLSFGQGAESQFGQSVFVLKASDKRLYNGKKEDIPYYSDGMLWLYHLALGFGIYTVLNIIVWVFFDYNFYVRLIASCALAGLCLFLAGKDSGRMVKSAAGFLLLLSAAMWLHSKTVLADDNGWSESGRTLKGLTKNGGWKKSSKSASSPIVSGDTSTLMKQLQNYQNFYKRKAQRGEPLTDTDYEVLKRLNQKVRDLKEGTNVSANEVEHLRKLMGESNTGNLSGDRNEAPKVPNILQDAGTAAGETFEEVARGETPAAMTVRGLSDVLTGGASEIVFTPAQAGYGMYDYVENGGTSVGEAFLQESTKVVVNEATNLVSGKIAEKVNHSLGIAKTPVFRSTSGNVKIGENTYTGVFSNYRSFNQSNLSSRATSATGQMHFAAYNTVNQTVGQSMNAMVNEASNSSSWWGEQSVQWEQNVRNAFSSSSTQASASSARSWEGTYGEAMRDSGLYNW